MINLNQMIFGATTFSHININDRFLQKPELKDLDTIINEKNIILFSTKDIRDLRIIYNGGPLILLWGKLFNEDRFYEPINLNNIQGSFLFIKYNQDTSDLICSNDKYGMRRFLYYFKDNVLYFSNKLLGLKKLINNFPSISEDSLLYYYSFGVTPNNKTLFNDIHKLPPGSTLTFNQNNINIDKYFSLHNLYNPSSLEGLSEEELCKKIDSCLLDSIKARITNNKQVGISISGGIDSGYIAQKIVESGSSVIGYNLAYKDYYDEFERADYITHKLNIPLKKISVDEKEIINNFIQVNEHTSEPVGLNNATLNFLFLEAAKDGIELLFDGDGSDRLFLGMNRYILYQKLIGLYNFFNKTNLLNTIIILLNLSNNIEIKKINTLFKNWNNGICPYPERKLGNINKYSLEYEQKIYNIGVKRYRDEFLKNFGNKDFGLYFTYHSIQMCPDLFFNDPFELQSQLGICPMPAFFHDPLVSLAISIPTKYKINNKQTKYILRKAAANKLDRNYSMLPKIGLQNSFSFINRTKFGKSWINEEYKKIERSDAYKTLKNIIPKGNIETNRLISLSVWNENNISLQ